jgi:hypothetical protein
MSQGYAVTSALTSLAAGSFVWSSGYTTARTRLNDGIMDEVAAGSSSAQATGQTLVIDLGTATALVGFALLNHNLATGACTVRIRAADDAAITTNVVTAKAASTIVTTAPSNKDTVLQFVSVTKRYWELTFAHTGTKIVRLGELLAFASITTLTRGSIYGDGDSERPSLNKNVSSTGHQRATYLGGPVRTKRLIYKDLSTSELAELRAMWAASTYGVSNLLFIPYIESTATAATDAAQECLWGKMQEEFDFTRADFSLNDPSNFVIVGQGREVGA